jgi:hypothetical protein
MTKESTLDWIKTLNDKEFAEFFYQAIEGRNTSDLSHDIGKGHFVLADVTVYFDEDDKDEPSISFIGLNDSTHYEGEWDDDSPICQEGTCQNCKNTICSWAKHMICPICLVQCYGS